MESNMLIYVNSYISNKIFDMKVVKYLKSFDVTFPKGKRNDFYGY